MTVEGFAGEVVPGGVSAGILGRVFDLPRHVLAELARNPDDPTRPALLNGWSDVREKRAYYYQSYEIGPDMVRADSLVDPTNPFCGRTPRPPELALPGWWKLARDYFSGMERIADALLRSIARSLGVAEQSMCAAFVDGQSALKLLGYPVRSSASKATVSADEGL